MSTCRVCHEPALIACVGCGAFQTPPTHVDPFLVLGLPRAWHIDKAKLEANYRELARKIHPDRQGAKSQADRRLALQWTANVNFARRALLDDTKRAWFLATGSVEPPERGLRLSPAFLAEMFEWREEEETAPGTFAERASERAAQIRAELEEMFTAWEAGAGGLGGVEEALSRLRYVS